MVQCMVKLGKNTNEYKGENKMITDVKTLLAEYGANKRLLSKKEQILEQVKMASNSQDRYEGIRSMNYDEVPSNTNKVTSIVENIALKQLEMEYELNAEIAQLKLNIISVDNLLTCLGDSHRDILFLRLSEGYTWEEVEKEIGMSINTCRKYYASAFVVLEARLKENNR